MPATPLKTLIAPSILSADFSKLGLEVRDLDAAGADLIHIDVMDGHFVPPISFGDIAVRAARGATKKPLDVHLMIEHPENQIESFTKAGADSITIHVETGPHAHRTLQAIKVLGKRAGIALNPATPVDAIDHVMDLVDMILVMTVNPGYGGQAYIPLEDKIRAVRAKITASGRAIDLEVDGGITAQTAKSARDAGANVFVAGTSILKDGPAKYAANIAAIRGDKKI